MSRDPIEITFTLDGAAQTITVDPARSVLSLLREDFGCHQLAAGCSPQGICGSCLAIVNGKPRVTCTMRAKTLNNKRLETLRSLSDVETRALQQAFIAEGAVQCGYCMPGILNQAAFLLRHERHPGDDLINQGLNLHLCRCTGYGAIRRAIRRAGDILDAEAPPAPPETILDAESRASLFGDLPRIDDIDRPGVVYMALRFAPKAGSQIDRIDFSEAEMVDGVVAILTADAIPGAQVVDGRPLLVPVGAVARSAADVVAVVAAETVSAAREAASVLEIDVTDGVVSPAPVDVPSFSIGDVPSDSAHRVCVTVRAASVDAAPLEPLAAVAVPVTPESLIVYSGSQDPFAERRRLEGYLGCAVQVESLPTGGSFGARGASIVSGLAALMAYTLERPAKLTLTHEDSERLLPAQPAMTATVTLSADADGQLSGVEADLQTDLGAYCDQGPTLLARALRLAAGPYAAPAVHATATATLTHRPPTGPGRGLWMAPLAFALEQAMDRLAETIAVDPMTLRRQNLDRPTVDGPVLDALRETYDEARASGQAVGLACARQVLGLGGAEQATVAFALRPGGEVRIHTGFAESGQGFRALAIDRAASITGAPRSVFTLQTDTALDVDSGPTIAGRDVWLGLAAIEDAARKMKTAPTLWVGDVLMGQATSDTEAVVFGFCAQLARLDADGTLQEVVVAVDVGDDVDAVITRGQIEGAVHMGMGIAVSEQKSTSDAGVPETQYRKLGPLKAKFSPSISSIAIGSSGVRPIGDVAVLATAPAIASALRLAGETPEDTLPMQRNPVARAMGVKPPRKRNRRR